MTLVIVLLAALALATACAPQAGRSEGPDLLPGALRSPPREIPLDIEGATVLIRDGRFEGEYYAIQGGNVRITFRTEGGPYTLTIERYVAGPQQLARDAATEVSFVAVEPGDLIMTIRETGARATLSIRGPTGRGSP